MDHAALDAKRNEMILAGQVMDAFDKFYADDVVMQENTDAPCVGKAANRERELAFFAKVEEFHGMKMPASAINGDVSSGEWEVDVRLKGMPRMLMQQVAVRRWMGGKAVHERFYYKG